MVDAGGAARVPGWWLAGDFDASPSTGVATMELVSEADVGLRKGYDGCGLD